MAGQFAAKELAQELLKILKSIVETYMKIKDTELKGSLDTAIENIGNNINDSKWQSFEDEDIKRYRDMIDHARQSLEGENFPPIDDFK
ncbi:MAG: hypothetical protein EA367_13440 [Leptolyngbya sp. DLM2.Bin15]|nr:MAG: hypothetical protein EA367_13440 [Leptolyngbya sp. DLM2.Bin15]